MGGLKFILDYLDSMSWPDEKRRSVKNVRFGSANITRDVQQKWSKNAILVLPKTSQNEYYARRVAKRRSVKNVRFGSAKITRDVEQKCENAITFISKNPSKATQSTAETI